MVSACPNIYISTYSDLTLEEGQYKVISLSVSGATGTKTFIVSGLPTPMVFDTPTVSFRGTPNVNGTFNVWVQVVDGNGCPGSKLFVLVVNPIIVIPTPVINAAIPSDSIFKGSGNTTIVLDCSGLVITSSIGKSKMICDGQERTSGVVIDTFNQEIKITFYSWELGAVKDFDIYIQNPQGKISTPIFIIRVVNQSYQTPGLYAVGMNVNDSVLVPDPGKYSVVPLVGDNFGSETEIIFNGFYQLSLTLTSTTLGQIAIPQWFMANEGEYTLQAVNPGNLKSSILTFTAYKVVEEPVAVRIISVVPGLYEPDKSAEVTGEIINGTIGKEVQTRFTIADGSNSTYERDWTNWVSVKVTSPNFVVVATGYDLLPDHKYYIRFQVKEGYELIRSEPMPYEYNSTGSGEINGGKELVGIYPNQVISGQRVNILSSTKGNIVVYDLSGKSLNSFSIQKGENTIQPILPAGVYLLRLTNANGKPIAIRKLIVLE